MALTLDQGALTYALDDGPWRLQGPVIGRHSVLCTECHDDRVFVRSSWGRGYGHRGGLYVARDEILSPRTTDLVTLLLAKEV